MKFYEVYDPKEDHTEWFTNKREAIRHWRDLDDTIADVRLIDIGKPTLETVFACLKGEGYVQASKTVWPLEDK